MSTKRILLIGSGGAGKSTLARRLGEQTGLPVVHLDKLYWTGEWQHLDKDAFDRALEAELAKPEWILDGNFTRTLPCRLEACDLVLYLDYPTRVCLWCILRRILRYHGETRPDMGENCPERFDLSFLKWICTFRRTTRPKLLEAIRTSGKPCRIFTSRREAEAFLKEANAILG